MGRYRASEPTLQTDEQIDVLEKTLDRLLDWNGRFDNKSSILIAVDLGMIGAISLVTRSTTLLKVNIIVAVSIAFLALSLVAIIYGEFPRTKSSNKSLIYFGTIANRDLNTFRSDSSKMSIEGYLEDLTNQCYVNSRIINRKSRALRFSLICTVVAMIPWTMAIYIA